MKRVLTAILCLAVPGLLLLNAWQGYRYNSLSDEVAALEDRQKSLLEANRDAIGRIAYESSPDRVAEKAAILGLVPATGAAVTRLKVGGAGSTANGATNPQGTAATNPRGTAEGARP